MVQTKQIEKTSKYLAAVHSTAKHVGKEFTIREKILIAELNIANKGPSILEVYQSRRISENLRMDEKTDILPNVCRREICYVYMTGKTSDKTYGQSFRLMNICGIT